MKRARGWTLIELMIVVALLGIAGASHGSLALAHRKAALAELQRARALELLEYHAGCLARGVAPDAAVTRRLEEGLPKVKAFSWRGDAPGVAMVSVTFWPAQGPRFSERLTVFGVPAP